jgi:hypothetical protein
MIRLLMVIGIALVVIMIFKMPAVAATDARAIFGVLGKGADSLITFINNL